MGYVVCANSCRCYLKNLQHRKSKLLTAYFQYGLQQQLSQEPFIRNKYQANTVTMQLIQSKVNMPYISFLIVM